MAHQLAPRRRTMADELAANACHVSVTGTCNLLSPAQRGALGRILASLGLSHRRPLVLHHGCSKGADEAAHQISRRLGRRWSIQGHPGADADGESPWRAQGIMRDLDVLHRTKLYEDRNRDIAEASDILVVLPASPELDPRSHQSGTWRTVQIMRELDRRIILIPRSGKVQDSARLSFVTERRAEPEPTGSVVKNVVWARRLARVDRKAGTAISRYAEFRSRYDLPAEKLTQQMWSAYTTVTRARKGKGRRRSVWTVSGGLPTMGKRHR